ncbi:hypothetical protein HMPREF9374_3101 [Desmospora sp. 8437]|nr:hypothetical protein HMPREF9374_3101 [Desmospora sp. 8437]
MQTQAVVHWFRSAETSGTSQKLMDVPGIGLTLYLRCLFHQK